MRAARTLSLDSTVIVDVPDPACGPGEVICRVLACATCGSDVHGWYVARKLPAVLGHEPIGEVVELGAGVERVARGDVVAIHHHAACGRCRACASGHETLCPQFRSTRLDPGGFAEYVRIQPELVGELLPLDGLDPVAATCTEPLACALRAQDRVGLSPRDALLVVGAGTSGLLHIAAARARGVERVLVAEPRADRRQRALSWGAEPFEPATGAGAGGAEPSGPTTGAAAGDTEPSGPVEVAIVTSHLPDAVAAAAAALAPGGRLCAYAPPDPAAPIAVDGAELFLRELTVTASWSAGAADMRAALALLRSGAVRTGELITHRFGLDETGAALAAQRDGSALKAVVLPWGEP
jgi:L-iditol 2-dehydrogenase